MELLQAGLLAAYLVAVSTPADITAIQYSGDAEGALRAAEGLVAAQPTDTTARLLAASAAIEAGRLGQAREHLRAVERHDRVPPRTAVLRALLDRRVREPSGAMMEALAAAWNEAGRPDLREDGSPLAWTPSAHTWTRELKASERLLFRMPQGADERLAVAIAASREGKEAGSVAHWQVLGALAHQECPGDPAPLNAAVERSFAIVKAAEPQNGYSELAVLVARCPRVLGAPELDRLEAAVRRQRFEYPRAQAFDELLRLARGITPAPEQRPAAVSAWLALDVGAFRLASLGEDQPDPRLRRRVGRVKEQVGLRLARGSAWLERLVGVSLAQRGAKLVGDEAHLAEVSAKVEEQRAEYQAWSVPYGQMGVWPFAAAWREWAPNEIEAGRAFLRAIGESPR